MTRSTDAPSVPTSVTPLNATFVRRRVVFAPAVCKSDAGRRFLRSCGRALTSVTAAGDSFEAIRERVIGASKMLGPKLAPEAACCASILCDLRMHGWDIHLSKKDIVVIEPAPAAKPEDRKSQIRDVLQIERDVQLREPSVRKFIRMMERPRLFEGEWKSIFSLMRDGRELSVALRPAIETPSGPMRLENLRECIDPYLHVIISDEKCEFTGLKLIEVWRYFRHTWSIPYNSTPGRKVYALVRDRAGKNHPIIGIGALGSSVVQLGKRDKWIGWTSEQLLERMHASPSNALAQWLASSLTSLIASVRSIDVCRAARISPASVRTPNAAGIERLRAIALESRNLHRLFPQRARHKGGNETVEKNWVAESRTHLFRGKRAAALADLLEARMRLLAAGFDGRPNGSKLARVLESVDARRAIATVLRYKKAVNVGVNMMDITVCGAVAPYNHLLGGKLVSLIMASPELVTAYNTRYRSATSLIASGMAGRPVHRRPRLVLLCTTSLYDVAPSQYNRLRVPAERLGGRVGAHLEFIELGVTEGYGSYHFSQTTRHLIEVVIARTRSGRVVNSIFGEGVNPKFRKIRSALDALGLPSDALLQHGSPRRIYAVPLAENFRDVLLDLERRPKYILNVSAGVPGIAEFWRERWLQKRIERNETLDDLRQHSLTHPIRHGARVPTIERSGAEQRSLFDDEFR